MSKNETLPATRPAPQALTAAMENLHAMRLGQACAASIGQPAGDLIDRGLILLRELNDRGYDVIARRP